VIFQDCQFLISPNSPAPGLASGPLVAKQAIKKFDREAKTLIWRAKKMKTGQPNQKPEAQIGFQGGGVRGLDRLS
jgi:hypothetical protein